MRPVSDEFLAAVRSSHLTFARARIGDDLRPLADGGDVLPLIDGEVTFDADADVRGTATITVGPEVWPDFTLGTENRGGNSIWPVTPVTPYGTEIWLESGVKLGGGKRELVGFGPFRVDSMEQPAGPGTSVTIQLSDRMASIRDARLLDPIQFPAGTNRADIVEELVAHVVWPVTIEWDSAPGTIPRAVTVEEDRLAFILDMVTTLGKVAYWDHAGHLQIKTPAPSNAPVWRVNAGRDGVLIGVGRSISRDGVYNGVHARGEAVSADGGISANAVRLDVDPDTGLGDLTPLNWFWGSFGQVPLFYSSPLLTTYDQCESAALTLLRKVTGLPYNVEFTAAPNPALEPLDVVEIDTRGMRELHRIKALRIPLTGGAVTATTLEQSVGL